MRSLPVQNPQSRFVSTYTEYEVDDPEDIPRATLHVYEDRSRSILSSNDSPDVGFTYSVNPYRGCGHSCAYCYARPSHEYLSFGAGTDFDRKIVVKREAATLLREAFEKKSWKGDLVVFSGVTDCYQPLERTLRLTQGCLEVCLAYKNPVGIITKSPVVERDAELLAELAKKAGCRVSISIPFWNAETARAIEPGVTTPARRMRILETLAKAGVPVGISVSPIIPGLSDQDVPELLQRAKDAGATHAFYVLLRLPGAVATVFEERLREELPLKAEKVLRRLREAHGGKLYDPTFGMRGRGDSVYAAAVKTLFEKTTKRLGLDRDEMNLVENLGAFARPPKPGTQTGFGF